MFAFLGIAAAVLVAALLAGGVLICLMNLESGRDRRGRQHDLRLRA